MPQQAHLPNMWRDLPTITQKVRLTPTGARMLLSMEPLPMHGYSRPSVYPQSNKAPLQGTCCKHATTNLQNLMVNICGTRKIDKSKALFSILGRSHSSEPHMQATSPRPDSEFWTGTCEVNGIGVPQLRARMRATTALTEFCMASSVTCCPAPGTTRNFTLFTLYTTHQCTSRIHRTMPTSVLAAAF